MDDTECWSSLESSSRVPASGAGNAEALRGTATVTSANSWVMGLDLLGFSTSLCASDRFFYKGHKWGGVIMEMDIVLELERILAILPSFSLCR